jgi:ribulose 1,5-bisphosphate synthetase/thiazole synthase
MNAVTTNELKPAATRKPMNRNLSRRDLIRLAGGAGLAAGLGGLALPEPARADPASRADAPAGVKVDKPTGVPARLAGDRVFEPGQTLPVLHQTDVLVVGAGPAGVCAALAARQTGARVTLVERYGHFGGLWTGGLVLEVAGLQVKGGKQVVRGVGEAILRRAERLDRAVINRRPGVNPTVDAEALKYVMVEMITEAGIDVFLDCYGVDAVVDGRTEVGRIANPSYSAEAGRIGNPSYGSTVQGAVFESKSGRQAILSTVVVDATGDGDVFAAAGCRYATMKYPIGLVHRIGNLDKVDREKAKGARPPRHLGSPTPIPGINWVNMQGPEGDGLDVAELTRMELAHRRQIWKQVQEIRKTPGYEKVYLVETAPQLGVRMSRLLAGTQRLTLADVKAGRKFDDCVGTGGDWQLKQGPWQIPYGVLVPETTDGILAAGRCISGEPAVADFVRIIPTCFVTGHAAGTAAALAVRDKCRPRDVELPKLQKLLEDQGAYLGT